MGGPSVSVRVAWPFWRILPRIKPELSIIREAGIELHQLADPELRLSYALVERLLEAGISAGSRPTLGLEAGLATESLDFGPLEFAVRTCRTAAQALETLGRYLRVLDDGLVGSLQPQSGRMVWRLDYPNGKQHPAAIDFAIAATLKAFRRYFHVSSIDIRVAVGHTGLTAVAAYEELLGVPVELNATFTGLTFAQELLDQQLPASNAALQRAFVAELDRIIERMPTSQSCSQQVRQHLLYRLTSGGCSASELARTLSLSQATLRRRLAREGTSYSKILDDARKEIALRQIRRNDRSVSEIARILGFNTAQGFCKAFKRWTTTTPMDYRNQVVEEEHALQAGQMHARPLRGHMQDHIQDHIQDQDQVQSTHHAQHLMCSTADDGAGNAEAAKVRKVFVQAT